MGEEEGKGKEGKGKGKRTMNLLRAVSDDFASVEMNAERSEVRNGLYRRRGSSNTFPSLDSEPRKQRA